MATSAGSRPSLSTSSICRRSSRASEPWCARTSSSPASSLSRCASRSARRRLLTKTIVAAVRADQLQDARVDLRPDAELRASGAGGRAAGLLARGGSTSPIAAMSSTGTTTWSSSVLAHAGVDDRDRARGAPRRRRHPAGVWRGRPGSRRRRSAAAASPTARCAAAAVPSATRAAPATAPGGRRAWCRQARGSRRR